MRKILIKTIVFIPLFLFIVIPLNAEYLFLKDGSIIKGKIVSETANDVVIRDEKNKVLNYPHNKVLRVLYTEISMGKVYVQMKSGENFKGYMIDEDRDSYIFRHDINKPEEFTVKRSKVLFIAERNPSELQGESTHNEISLKWSPPYDKMKLYNVYLKKNKDDKFTLADTSWSNTARLKNLNSFTKYTIKVTGVDDSGTETTPSNEIEVTTYAKVEVKLKDGKSFRTYLSSEDWEKYTFRDDPGVKKEYSVKRLEVVFITERYPTRLKGEGGFSEISLGWDLPFDSMKYFNVYYKKSKDDKYIIADKAGSNSFKLKNLNSNTKYFIKVTGITEAGTETTPSNEIEIMTKNIPTSKSKFLFQINPAVLIPVGNFSTISDAGYGGYFVFALKYEGFITGFETGLFNFNGQKTSVQGMLAVNRMLFLPMTWMFGYRFNLPKSFSITPLISVGAAYFNIATKIPQTRELNYFDPYIKTGVSADYTFSELFSLGMALEYGMFLEKTAPLMFLSVSVQCQFRF